MKVEWQTKEEKPELISLLLDQHVWRDVHLAIVGRRPKLVKEIASYSDWQSYFDQFEYQAVKVYVLRRLSSQHYHSAQLKKLLKERLVQSHTIEKIIQDCIDWGYLNDQTWLESMINQKLKKFGLKMIVAKLKAKGISLEEIKEVINQRLEENSSQEELTIQRLLQTRYRSKNLKDYREKQKVIASLARKGFAFEAIQQALANVAQNQ